MPVKTYRVADALLLIRPDGKFKVSANDTDQIRYIDWPGARPSEANIDSAGSQVLAMKQAQETKLADARSTIGSGPPPQSLPGLAARVEALEVILKDQGVL